MAAGPITQISDIVQPEIFSSYVQLLTERKNRLIESGVVQRSGFLDGLLQGGGLTFNVPSFNDLDDDDDRISTESAHAEFGGAASPDPKKITGNTEIAVRMNRNQSWSSADLTGQLSGADPMDSIATRVANYWSHKLQKVFIATMNGVIADNTAADSGDYTNDVSGASYVPGVTDFSTEAALDAFVTMGDSMDDLGAMMVHSVVYNRMQKNNLIDFIPDARGEVEIPTFLGKRVIIDDGLPVTANVYDTWIFGGGAVQLGVGSPKVGTEVEREAGAGNGGGQEILYSRQEWTLHPAGHAYIGTSPVGGPTNAATANNLAAAGSWNRVYPERKQIRFARLVTREA